MTRPSLSLGNIDFKQKSIDLADKGLESFSPTAKNKIEILNLARNKIVSLQKSMPKLKELDLSMNQMLEISPDLMASIKSYPKLCKLDLSCNFCETVPNDLDTMKNLKELKLNGNRINKFQMTSPTLVDLDLSHNRLVGFPKLPPNLKSLSFDFNKLETLDLYMPTLTKLSLQLTGINSIAPNLVFPNLKVLDLSRNNLQEIPDLFKFVPSIQTLDLSDNLLTIFPPLPYQIVEFSIRGNVIDSIPTSISKLPKLMSLDVSENSIKIVPKLPKSIMLFYANDNPIIKIEPSTVGALTRISFENNELTDMPEFKNNRIMDLQYPHCNLKKINLNTMLSKVSRLDFQDNEITELPPKLFSFKKLQFVYFQDNNITSIPPEIANLKHLSLLNISFNPIPRLPELSIRIVNLYIGYLGLEELPCEFSNMVRLKTLSAQGNKLKSLPLFSDKLQTLYLSRNQFTEFPIIPGTIVQLDLSFNEISVIPDNLSFPSLVELEISHNKIKKWPNAFEIPSVQYIRIGCNPISGNFDPTPYPSLVIMDIVSTNLVFPPDRIIRELITNVKPEKPANHIKFVDIKPWIGFSEIKGIRPDMEDSIIIRPNIRHDLDLFGIFDGHGGYKAAVHGTHYIENGVSQESFTFRKRDAHNMIHALEKEFKEMNLGDGATIAFAIMSSQHIMTCHVGDTRIVVINQDGSVSYSTKDHKPTERNEFTRIHKMFGKIVSNRVHGILSPSRSMGDFLIPAMTALPEITVHNITKTEKWMIICCDGVFDVLTNERLGEMALKSNNPSELAYDIRNHAYADMSMDNISVIVVDLQSSERQVMTDHSDSYLDDSISMSRSSSQLFESSASQQPEPHPGIKISPSCQEFNIFKAEEHILEENEAKRHDIIASAPCSNEYLAPTSFLSEINPDLPIPAVDIFTDSGSESTEASNDDENNEASFIIRKQKPKATRRIIKIRPLEPGEVDIDNSKL